MPETNFSKLLFRAFITAGLHQQAERQQTAKQYRKYAFSFDQAYPLKEISGKAALPGLPLHSTEISVRRKFVCLLYTSG